ncbi:hypothetical protein [Nocardia sp. NPDC005998]
MTRSRPLRRIGLRVSELFLGAMTLDEDWHWARSLPRYSAMALVATG